jgi:chromosome segregation ATPase
LSSVSLSAYCARPCLQSESEATTPDASAHKSHITVTPPDSQVPVSVVETVEQPGNVDNKECKEHGVKIVALQTQFAKLDSEANKAEGVVGRVADLEENLTAYKQEKDTMEKKLGALEEEYMALKAAQISLKQELADTRRDNVMSGSKHEALVAAHALLEEELANLKLEKVSLVEKLKS